MFAELASYIGACGEGKCEGARMRIIYHIDLPLARKWQGEVNFFPLINTFLLSWRLHWQLGAQPEFKLSQECLGDEGG